MKFMNFGCVALLTVVITNGCSRTMKFTSRTDNSTIAQNSSPAQSTGDLKGGLESPAKSLPPIIDTNGKIVTPVEQQIANLSKPTPAPKPTQLPDAFFKFSKDKIVTNKDFAFDIEITNSDIDFQTLRISILDGTGQSAVLAQSISADGSTKYSLNQKLIFADGIYSIEAVAVNAEGIELRTEKIPLYVDRSSPLVLLYLGVEPSRDVTKLACSVNPGSRSDVAMRIIPYDVCAVKTGAVALRITDICVLPESQASTPPVENDSCWVSYESMDFLALLANGKNDLVAFARDELGNIGRGNASVVLKPANNPPVANLVEPSSSLVASKIFNDGDSITLRWKVNSVDPYEKIRIAISMIDADNGSRFVNLACNFANQRLAKACAEEAAQDTTGALIKSEGNNTGSFTFKLPAGWGGAAKHFFLQVQAFDVSGNSSVVATQDFNRGYEVLAGREFDGKGGSGLRLNRFDSRGGYVRVNKKGEVFDSAYGYKLSAFDGRSCRFFKTPSVPKTQTDCPDAFMNYYNINPYWAYNRPKDVFYALATRDGQEHIVEIDFNKKAITEIFGGSAKIEIDSSLKNADVKKYRASGIHGYIAYESTLDRIFFRTLTQMYTINPTTLQISYLLGSSSSSAPADMQNVKQRDIVLADSPYKNMISAFAVTPDRRMFIALTGSDRANAGGLLGTTLLIRDFSLDNPDNVTEMTMLPAEASNGGFISDYYYNPTHNSLVATLYQNKVSELVLPAKSTTNISDYKWTTLLESASNSANIFKKPLVASQLPLNTPFASSSIAPSGFPNSFYIFDVANGYLDYVDIAALSLEPVMGTDVGNTGDELGINRDLRAPRHLFLDNDGNLVFSDLFNIQRLDLKNADGQNPMIHTIRQSANNYPMRFDSAKNQIVRISTDVSSVEVFDYSKFSDVAVAPVFQFLGSNMWGQAMSLSENLSNLKVSTIYIGSTASVRQTDFAGYAKGNPAVPSVLLTNPSGYSYTSRWEWVERNPMECYVNDALQPAGTAGCAQAPLVNGNYYEASKYLAGGDTNHWGDSAYYNTQYTVPNQAFALNDTAVVACISNQFVLIEKASNRVYPFTPIDQNGNNQVLASASVEAPCYDRQAMFFNQNGRIFYTQTWSAKPYEIDLSTVHLSNKAKFTPITTQMPLAPGYYGSLFITDTYVYYTHLHNVHRVLRNRR